MRPQLLTEAVRLAYKHRRRDGRAYSLAAVGERRDGAVVSAINGWATAPDSRWHAECKCLRKLGVGGVLYVARVRKDGSVGNARPCRGCQLMLRFSETRAFFTIDERTWGCVE